MGAPKSAGTVVVWEAGGQPAPGESYGRPIATRLRAAGFTPVVVPLTLRPPTADELAADLHVLSGGATSSRSTEPWLVEVRRLLDPLVERALHGRATVIGFCLGSQLLARTLAGPETVRPAGNGMEVGLHEVVTTDPTDIAGDHLVAEFHHHEIDPERLVAAGGRVTLTNDHTEVQGFRAGAGVHGYQFHPEFDPALLRATLRANAPLLVRTGASLVGSLATVAAGRGGWREETFDRLVVDRLGAPSAAPAILADAA